MIASGNLDIQVRLATVVVPVALYFLVLGLLNSRKHPQLLTARQDFVLLVGALCPLVIIPAVCSLSGLWSAVLIGVLAAAVVLALAADRRDGNWVIYNVTHEQALKALERALAELGINGVRTDGGLSLGDEDDKGFIQVRSFPLLRNASVRLRGAQGLAPTLGRQLACVLCGLQAEAAPMAVGLLLVATAMMVAPLAMIVHRAPEIVRIVSDLLH